MTRREQLQKLPLQKRLQAIENTRRNCLIVSFRERLDFEADGLALASLFVFANTKQGHDYWIDVNRKYFW